ncbi:MAG: response regulator [Desulfobacterales bacterium]|nr:response regulator [Candidatus Omnitrophota bacterium]MBU4425919.1 response regulator [Pseudomonadota bacterium]MCG2774767.1 response regulator [Desulfobacterales bacterium]
MDKKILLVDDEEDIRDVLDISLSDLGYKVFTAKNGEEAFQIFRNVNPPIVLTDIRMPIMDGIELLQKIKKENTDTEVIMFTGHGDMDLAIKSLKYEATDFITKPINDEILGFALERAHERISMRQRIREYTENLEEMVREKSARLVEVERLIAVGQVIEGLSSATRNIVEDFEGGITYFNELPCLVSIHNRDLKVVATNQLYKERLGDKIGCNSWDAYKEGAGRSAKCPVGKTFHTGKGQRSKETIQDVNGREVPVIVHTAPIRSGESDVELVLEISADITEMNRLQEELRTTQQRYQQLFDEVPCYISVQDGKLRLVATNRQFKEDFGDEIGSYCYNVYKHRNEPCPDCPVVKTFESGKSQQSETVVTSKTGEQYNVLTWTAPIRKADGEVTQVMEMSTNITQIRRLQDHLSSLGLLIGSISHGIKGIMTGLDGGMYWLDTGIEKGNQERIEKGWDVIKLMVDRLKNMVLNLLYYAKERDLNWERTDVLSLAKDVASTVEPKIKGYSIEFIHDFDRSIGKFEVDTSVVSSALINILENAMDACIEDKSKKSHKIIFSVTQDKDHIVFDIHDNGMGMDRETRENIFTLFFSSKGSKGTGLGLFVSNKIIQEHGGSIRADSTPGQGSHFNIRLPKVLPDILKSKVNKKAQSLTIE